MKLTSKPLAIIAALAVTVPAIALAADRGPQNTPPRAAYGVTCDRPPYEASRDNVNHGKCVRALAKGTHGDVNASDAARRACRQATPPLPGNEFGECVSSTETLVKGLKALKAT